jgi:hypothetical protein
VIVASEIRNRDFQTRVTIGAFKEIRERVNFLSYEMLVKEYEHEMLESSQRFSI